jgi:uncharacterized membrane protein YphA (DoxX/SURF4 family)
MTLPESRAVSLIGLGLRLAAAGIWIFAGAVKILDLQSFQLVVLKYGILPRALAAPFAYVLPFLEVGIGLYFVLGLLVRGAALVGTLLFASFLTAQVWAMAKGIVLDCGCFGPALQSTVSPLTLIRDFCLGIPTFLMLAFPARLFSLDRRLFGAPDLFGGTSPRR